MRSWCRLPVLVMVPLLVAGYASAQEPPPSAGNTKPQNPVVGKPEDEPLRQALRETLRIVASMEENPGELSGDPSFDLRDQGTQYVEVNMRCKLGHAQVLAGDIEAARKNCQATLDVIAFQTYRESEQKASFFEDVARVQALAGDRDGALDLLRRAHQTLQSAKTDRPSYLPAGEPENSRATALARLASAQRELGNREGARKSFDEALQCAHSIAQPVYRVDALLKIADAQDADGKKRIREKAISFALSLDEFPKSRAVEFIVEHMVETGDVEDALRLIEKRLEGDLKALGIVIVAEQLASAQTPPAAKLARSMCDLANKAEFQTPSKRLIAFKQVALALAKAGDAERAYQAIDSINPEDDVTRANLSQARIWVFLAVAEAQVAARDMPAARNTLDVVLDALAEYRGYGWEDTLPFQETAALLTRAGNPGAATELIEGFLSNRKRACALADIAVAQAEGGDHPAARKCIEQALSAAEAVPHEVVWDRESGRRRLDSHRSRTLHERAENFRQTSKGEVLKAIAVARAKTGDLAGALETAKAIPSEGNFASEERNAAILEIASFQAKGHDYMGAFEAAELAVGDFDASTSLKSIARIQGQAGDVRGVLSWVVKIRRGHTRFQAIEAMADGIVASKLPKAEPESKRGAIGGK
jgi:tetratricopeptide (TPR) repeat protein